MNCSNALKCPNVVWIDDADGITSGFCECNKGGPVAQKPTKKKTTRKKVVKESNDGSTSK